MFILAKADAGNLSASQKKEDYNDAIYVTPLEQAAENILGFPSTRGNRATLA